MQLYITTNIHTASVAIIIPSVRVSLIISYTLNIFSTHFFPFSVAIHLLLVSLFVLFLYMQMNKVEEFKRV
jgi:hypothetical protein